MDIKSKNFPPWINQERVASEAYNIADELLKTVEELDTRVFYITDEYLESQEVSFVTDMLMEEIDEIETIEVFDYDDIKTTGLKNLFIIDLFDFTESLKEDILTDKLMDEFIEEELTLEDVSEQNT